MKKLNLSGFILFVFILLLLWTVTPVTATSSQPQAVQYTPTPDADGRYLYIVQENDSCLSIALRFLNGDTNTLRELNNLDEECSLQIGQEILLGIYEAPTVTPGPSPTPTPVTPTPTPYAGNGEICIFLFNDVNGDGMAEDAEPPIEGGAISITNNKGTVSLTGTTLGIFDPLCFQEIPEGEYRVSVAPPEGYNPTTIKDYSLKLMAGDQAILDFGAQISSLALMPEDTSTDNSSATSTTGSQRSPMLGILGGLLILGGIGLGVYFRWLKR